MTKIYNSKTLCKRKSRICKGCKKSQPSILRHLQNQKHNCCRKHYTKAEFDQFKLESKLITANNRKEKDRERYLKRKESKLKKPTDTDTSSLGQSSISTNKNKTLQHVTVILMNSNVF